ncbi:Hypothetical protein HVR_LOCUS1018 [uncultured virus]|nr:Hypothetical protein HVR_LOCUS1018 [uncultured virus]
MTQRISLKQFAEKYELSNKHPLKVIFVEKDYEEEEAERVFGNYIDRNDPKNNFVEGSAFISVSRSSERFNFVINSLEGISTLPVEYKGKRITLGGVPKLIFLCGFNEISELPGEFNVMTNLFSVFLKNNKIVRLPENIPPIARIYFTGNLLTNIPENVFHTNLEKLSLSENTLNRISPSIGKCSKLMHFDINAVGIDQLPETISSCQKLRVFSAMNNNLLNIPSSFVQNVPVVNEIRLDNNPNLKEIPYKSGYAWGRMTATLSINGTSINLSNLHPDLQKHIVSSDGTEQPKPDKDKNKDKGKDKGKDKDKNKGKDKDKGKDKNKTK